jgi:hypothetical protein
MEERFKIRLGKRKLFFDFISIEQRGLLPKLPVSASLCVDYRKSARQSRVPHAEAIIDSQPGGHYNRISRVVVIG